MSPFTSPLARPPSLAEEEPGETSEGSSSASSVSSVGTLVPPSPHRAIQNHGQSAWHQYFDQELFLEQPTGYDVPVAKYHVYLTSPKDPTKNPLFVCHHGAGASGLSFALFARHIRSIIPESGILSVDAREHGSVVDHGESSPDFSLQYLAKDLLQMIHLTTQKLWNEFPKHIVLVGHSLGGAVVSRVARDGSLGSNLVGFCVIDIVEGSAMEGLKSMQSLLRTRPSSFPSVQSAIDWHIRSRTLRNPESSTISTPSLLQETQSGAWIWRTDLSSTSPYWEDWFTGLSSNFLSGKGAKLLLLAGTDRLDKELMIGQMQGKFQLQVFPESGHFVHEDVPERTAEVIADFYRRNDRSTLVLPPKVSDLLAQGKKV